MARMGARARGWVGLWAGLMIAGCAGRPTSESTPQTPSSADSSTPPDDRVAQPPSDQNPSPSPPSTSEPAPPSDSISLAPSRWRASLGTGDVSVATDADGNVYALALDPKAQDSSAEDPPLVLTKTNASGTQLWRKSWTTPGSHVLLNPHSLAISPEGNIFLAYTVDCPPGQTCHLARFTLSSGEAVPAWGAVLVKLSPDAKVAWVQTLHSNGERVLGVAVNSMGTSLLLVRNQNYQNSDTLYWYQWDGTFLKTYEMDSATSIAFDPQDNIIVGSYGPSIAKYSPDLSSLLWSKGFVGPAPSTTSNWITSLGTSAKGTVVASGYLKGDYNWGSSALTGGGTEGEGTFLIVAEADGTPRWGVVTSTAYDGANPGQLLLAVDPSGQVVLASGVEREGNRVSVDRYNLAGDHLWSHELGNTRDCGNGLFTTRVTSITIAPNHDAILGGVHTGAANIGSGCVQGVGGFVVDLKP